MEQERIPKPGQVYRHFKNNLYQIITVAIHTETGEKMVVYQALYGNFKTYVRPLSMFTSEVNFKKYPEAKQKYRFEQIILQDENSENPLDITDKATTESGSVPEYNITLESNTTSKYNSQFKINEESKSNTASDINTAANNNNMPQDEEGSINPVLLEFLEADSYEEKLAILLHKKKYITDKVLNDMAVSIDCTLDDGAIEERIAEFAYCLQTHARFENRRLR